MLYKPLKRFGQNYLHDKNILNKIYNSIAPQPNDYIIEIMIDGFEGKPPYDYSKSKIYKISIEKINDIKNKN